MVQLVDSSVPASNPRSDPPVGPQSAGTETTGTMLAGAGTTGGASAARQQLLAALLLVALAGSAFTQGGFYSRGQGFLIALLLAAGCLALTIRRAELGGSSRTATLIVAVAGWPVLAGAQHSELASGLRLGLLALGVPVTIGCGRRLSDSAARLLLDGLVGLGAVLALIGWYGVLGHRAPLAIEGQGLYRAASTLSYPNAAGVLLALLALLGIALAVGQPSDRRWQSRGALLSVLLVGLAATLSRGALVTSVAGVLVLLAGLGARRVLTVLAWPLLGAVVGAVALLPAAPTTAHPNPLLAVAGLLLGSAIGSIAFPAGRATGWLALPYVVLVLAGSAIAVWRSFAGIGHARLNLDSPDRWAVWHAAWRVFATHPVVGVGPGLRSLSWHPSTGGTQIFSYAHNEYLQLLADLGVLGLALLVAGLVSIAALLRRNWPVAGTVDPPQPAEPNHPYGPAGPAGPADPNPCDPNDLADPMDMVGLVERAHSISVAAVAIGAALLVSMTVDFTGHFPALVLTAAAVVGCAVPDRPARP
jgi:O-antigen ligase